MKSKQRDQNLMEKDTHKFQTWILPYFRDFIFVVWHCILSETLKVDSADFSKSHLCCAVLKVFYISHGRVLIKIEHWHFHHPSFKYIFLIQEQVSPSARKTSRKDLKWMETFQIDVKEKANCKEKIILSYPHQVLETKFLFAPSA